MKEIVHTEKAPAAIGPYSQAVVINNVIYTSGQLPLDPVAMVIVSGGVKNQTLQALNNLKSILDSAGSSLSNVVKTTCYLADINDFAAFNEIYCEFFGGDKAPARSCFEVAKLPKDALVEIEAIAVIN